MKALVFLLAALSLVLIVRCSRDYSDKELSSPIGVSKPVYICTLPDSRDLYCICVPNPESAGSPAHYVYFTHDEKGSVPEVSVNKLEGGKHKHNTTQVLIPSKIKVELPK